MEIGIKIKLVNHVLLEAILEMAPNAAQFCTQYGFNSSQIGTYINLKAIPSKGVAERLSEIIGLSLDTLFPPDLCKQVAHKPMTAFYFHKRVEMLPFHDVPRKELSYIPEQDIEQKEIHYLVMRHLNTLDERERNILKMRFGLDGEERTLRECAKVFGVSKDRISQIEARALRKLRHPIHSRELKEAL